MSRLHSTIIAAGGAGGTQSAFTIIQPDAGTSPVATGPADTLTLTGGASGPILTTGNSGTDTVSYSILTHSLGNSLLGFSPPNTFKGNNTGSTATVLDLTVLQSNILLTMPVYNAGNSGATLTFDWNNGPYQKCALTANCNFVFSNPVDGAVYMIEITQGVSAYTVTYPSASVTYAGGYASIPAVTTTNAALDLANLAYNGGASKYRLTIAQNFS